MPASHLAQAINDAMRAFTAACSDPAWTAAMTSLLRSYEPADDLTQSDAETTTDELIGRLEETVASVPPDSDAELGWHAATLSLASDAQLRRPAGEPAVMWVMVGTEQAVLLLAYEKHALGAAMVVEKGEMDTVVPYTAKKHADVELALMDYTAELEDDGAVLAQPPTRVLTRLPDGTPSCVEVVRAARTAGVTGLPGWPA